MCINKTKAFIHDGRYIFLGELLMVDVGAIIVCRQFHHITPALEYTRYCYVESKTCNYTHYTYRTDRTLSTSICNKQTVGFHESVTDQKLRLRLCLPNFSHKVSSMTLAHRSWCIIIVIRQQYSFLPVKDFIQGYLNSTYSCQEKGEKWTKAAKYTPPMYGR